MSSMRIPETGLTLESSRGSSSKAGPAVPSVIGLTLSNSMIEEMIKCVQHDKPIQFSMGDYPVRLEFLFWCSSMAAFE